MYDGFACMSDNFIVFSQPLKAPLKADKQVQTGFDNNLVISRHRKCTNFVKRPNKEVFLLRKANILQMPAVGDKKYIIFAMEGDDIKSLTPKV